VCERQSVNQQEVPPEVGEVWHASAGSNAAQSTDAVQHSSISAAARPPASAGLKSPGRQGRQRHSTRQTRAP
jgi:hypothetical protein